jgi:predicted amidohydrolase
VLKAALLELPARHAAVDAAFGDLEALLTEGPCDLALLPECSLTGYVDDQGRCDPTPLAEALDGPTARRVASLAKRYGTAIGAPLVERDEARYYNSYLVIDRHGALLRRYRKRHPWFPERWATPGTEPHGTFELGGLTLSLAICFDVHFLEVEAACELQRADALLFPSAWVDGGPNDLRGPLFGALATRFGVVIANANWGPGTPRVRGQGGSRVVGPEGELARLPPGASAPARLDVTLRRR